MILDVQFTTGLDMYSELRDLTNILYLPLQKWKSQLPAFHPTPPLPPPTLQLNIGGHVTTKYVSMHFLDILLQTYDGQTNWTSVTPAQVIDEE